VLRPRDNTQQQENHHGETLSIILPTNHLANLLSIVASQSALEIKQEPMPEIKQEPNHDKDPYTTCIPKHIAGENGEPTAASRSTLQRWTVYAQIRKLP
jgi:hypothetical protein